MNRGVRSSAETACAENIVFLYLLHPIPLQPSSNPVNPGSTSISGHSLPFETERRLISILAFLSNTTDDIDHVPAVCIQETKSPAQLHVKIAVNQSSPNEGDGVLDRTRQGLENILNLLSGVTKEDNHDSNTDTAVLDAIVTACSQRIKCRLRLIQKKGKSPKQSLKEIINAVIICLQAQAKRSTIKNRLLPTKVLFLSRAKGVLDILDSWYKHRTEARLLDIVNAVDRLWQVEGLAELINAIPNKDMNPNLRKSFVDLIEKVARYKKAAIFLCATARKMPLVRNMQVTSVRLPPAAFPERSLPTFPQLDLVFSRMRKPNAKQIDLGLLGRLLGTNANNLRALFAEQTLKTIQHAKVHAEVQLLFSCEEEKFKNPPRVICSSKDACYLCNTLIQMYSNVHVPKSHGRLYPGWRLPPFPRSHDIVGRFNKVLEDTIQQSISQLLYRRRKTLYPMPNESTLITLPNSAATSSHTFHITDRALETESGQQIEGSGRSHLPVETKGSDSAVPYLQEFVQSEIVGDAVDQGELRNLIAEAEVASGKDEQLDTVNGVATKENGEASNAISQSSLLSRQHNLILEDATVVVASTASLDTSARPLRSNSSHSTIAPPVVDVVRSRKGETVMNSLTEPTQAVCPSSFQTSFYTIAGPLEVFIEFENQVFKSSTNMNNHNGAQDNKETVTPGKPRNLELQTSPCLDLEQVTPSPIPKARYTVKRLSFEESQELLSSCSISGQKKPSGSEMVRPTAYPKVTIVDADNLEKGDLGEISYDIDGIGRVLYVSGGGEVLKFEFL